jgi:hypothetical protein
MAAVEARADLEASAMETTEMVGPAFGGAAEPGGFCTIDKADYRWSEDVPANRR